MPSSYTLGDHFEAFIQTQLDSGRYQNASEVVRASLRLMEDHDILNQAKMEILRGDIRGTSRVMTEDIADVSEARQTVRTGRPNGWKKPS